MKETAVIEIGKNNIKIAAARFSLKRSLQKFFCVAKDISFLDEAGITKLITDIFSSLKIKPKYLSLSIPRELVTIRNISLPSQDYKEISKMVDLHLVRVVPYKKEDIIYSFAVTDTNEEGSAKILLSIVQKSVLSKHLKILSGAGLFADKIYLSSYGVREWMLSQCRSEMEEDTVYLGLDIDSQSSDFIAFSKEHLLFTRSIVLGAAQLSEQESVRKLIKEVKNSLVFFRSEYEYKKPQKMVISGALEQLKGLEDALMRELEIPVLPLSIVPSIERFPYKDINIPDSVSATAVKEFLMDNSKRVSFIVPETQVRKALKEKVKDLIATGSYLIAIFFVISALFLGRIHNRQTYLNTLNNKLEEIKDDIGNLMGQSKRIEVTDRILKDRKTPLVFFQELYPLVPSSVAVTNLSIQEDNNIVLRGEALRLSDVFAFINILEDNKYFKGVEARYTRKKKTKDGELTDFELAFLFGFNEK